MTFYTLDTWETKFKPIINPTNIWDDSTYSAFETYGEDLEVVRKHDAHNVWTEVDGDGGTYICAGYHLANRIQYYVTEVPWTDMYDEVPTWVYKECDCVNENTGEYDPNCVDCDEGEIDLPIMTVADLREIYGEDATIE